MELLTRENLLTPEEASLTVPGRRRRRLEPWPEAIVEMVRDRALSDLWFFETEVLGYSLLHPQPHGELCTWLMAPSPGHRLILMPRTSFKTTIITEGYSLWCLVKDTSERLLIDSDLRANSKRMAGKIRWHIESNKRFGQLFGDLKREPGWTDEYFTVKRSHESREPSIYTAGMDAVVVSLHFDRIFGDDLQNNTNINTKEAIDKVIGHIQLYEPLLELPEVNPYAEILLTGTRWDDADAYGHALRERSRMQDDEFMAVLKEKGQARFGDLDVFYRSAYRPDGTPLFSLFTERFLEQKRERLGAYLFAANYLNDPVPVENATFRREYFTYFDRLPEKLAVYTVVDPALSEKKHGDFTAIVTVAVDPGKVLYVLDAWHGKINPKATIDKMFEVYDAWQPQVMGLETVGFQKTLKYMLYDEMARRGQFLPLRELAPDTRTTKEMRIKSLQPYYQTGKIAHRRGLHDLETELLRFPRAQHDDLADALAYVLQMLAPVPRKWEPREYVPENIHTGY